MAKHKEYKPLFTCHDAILRLCKRSKRRPAQILKKFQDVIGTFFLTLVLDDCFQAISLILACGIRLCVIELGKRLQHDIVLDTRFLEDPQLKPIQRHIFWIMERNRNALMYEQIKIKLLPNLLTHSKKRVRMRATLWDILHLHQNNEQNVPEPQSLSALKQVLEQYGLQKKCTVLFLPRLLPTTQILWYAGQTDSTIADFTFYAYTKKDYSLGYAYQQPKSLNCHNIFVQKSQLRNQEPVPDTNNRRMSVSVSLTGLTLAHYLGCCSIQEMESISQTLAKCVGSLWATFDDQKHVRHIFFHFKDHIYQPFHFYCKDDGDYLTKNDLKLRELMKIIQASTKIAADIKYKALLTIVQRLLPFSTIDHRNLWSKCLTQLTKAISKFKVFLFAPGDEEFHFLRAAIATCFERKKTTATKVSILSDNTIGALQTKTVDFINLFHYFNHSPHTLNPWQDDDVLWEVAQGWIMTTTVDSKDFAPWTNPQVKHSIREIKNQKHSHGECSMQVYLQKRAQRNASIIAQLWSALVFYCLHHFGYDLASKEHCSMGHLAFQIIWLQYAKKAGPLGHSIENIHPFAEHLLRPFCQGGFSYSRQTFLSQHQPIPTAGLNSKPEFATSIAEYDLTSAYGYSANCMAAPKGFAINFGEGMKTQHRYNLFEYRAVMYTIWKWTKIQHRQIKTIFSNYSFYGLMFIGQYPVDLVAIMEDGTVEIVQMDGHFCHGHYDAPDCLTLPRYANDKTREQCEEQTRKRDSFIQQWIQSCAQSGRQINYSVLTDCCDTEYKSYVLKNAFDATPELFNLVKGLDKVDGTLNNVNLNNLTFFALVTCYVQAPHLNHQDATFGPIFNHQTEEKILLTSDYYNYLNTHYKLKIVCIHWISFYKRCWILPTIFSKLINLRCSSSKPKASFLKTIINCACGYFGLNRNKSDKKIISITPHVVKRFNQSIYSATPIEAFEGQELILVERHSQRKKLAPSVTPLPLFIGIIEYGKMRLNYIIQILQKYLRQTAFCILYSNVDNLIVACSKHNLEDALVDLSPNGRLKFLAEWATVLADEPGCLKLEWKKGLSDNWQFVTPFCMFYVLKTTEPKAVNNDSDILLKGLSKMHRKDSFDVAMSILRKEQTTIQMEKRTNKLYDLSTAMVTLQY